MSFFILFFIFAATAFAQRRPLYIQDRTTSEQKEKQKEGEKGKKDLQLCILSPPITFFAKAFFFSLDRKEETLGSAIRVNLSSFSSLLFVILSFQLCVDFPVDFYISFWIRAFSQPLFFFFFPFRFLLLQR